MPRSAVYATPSPVLAETPPGALQVSPLLPGSAPLEAFGEGQLTRLVMAAPAGVLERRYQLALGLRALRPGSELTVLAPKDKGGARLRKELEGFGCTVEESARRHHRICACLRPDTLTGVEPAITAGGARFIEALQLWSQPGVFSWDRIDPGSALLASSLPPLAGRGADFGCGLGYLARTVLASPGVSRLSLIDIDRRAVEAARHNVDDTRAELLWADIRRAELGDLDFVVMNPPFHDGGGEDRALGQAFIQRAAAALRKDGVLWLVANRHLPYEAVLKDAFARVTSNAEQGGYKVFEARR